MAITVRLTPGLRVDDSKIDAQGQQAYPDHRADIVELEGIINRLTGKTRGPGGWEYANGETSGPWLSALVKPVHVGDTAVTLTPIAVNHQVWNALRAAAPVHFEAGLEDSVTLESSVTWSESETLSVSFTVGVEMGGGPAKASASSTVSVSATVGKDVSKSRAEAVGAAASVSADLAAGTAAIAALLLMRGTLSADVTYASAWVGQINIHVGGATRTLTPAELAQAGLKPPFGNAQGVATSALRFDFDAESNATVVAVPDVKPATIDGAVRSALQDLGG